MGRPPSFRRGAPAGGTSRDRPSGSPSHSRVPASAHPAGPFVPSTAWARAAGVRAAATTPDAATSCALFAPLSPPPGGSMALPWAPRRCRPPPGRSPAGMWVPVWQGRHQAWYYPQVPAAHPLTRGLRSRRLPPSGKDSTRLGPLPTHPHPAHGHAQSPVHGALWAQPTAAGGPRASEVTGRPRPGAYQLRVEGPAGRGVGALRVEALPQDHHHGRASGAGLWPRAGTSHPPLGKLGQGSPGHLPGGWLSSSSPLAAPLAEKTRGRQRA